MNVFPQEHRVTCIAMCNFLAKAACILVPMVNELPEIYPMLILSIVLLIAFINSFCINAELLGEEEKAQD